MAAVALDCARGILNAGSGRVFNFSSEILAVLIACFFTGKGVPSPIQAMLGLHDDELVLQQVPEREQVLGDLEAIDRGE